MGDFFKSDIIRDELTAINDLQSVIYNAQGNYDSLERDEKIEHIENLTELLERQRVMYTRLSLSEDPDAIRMKEELIKSVTILGFPPGTDISILFSGMSQTIEALKEKIDY